ncbi:protein S100-A13 [Rhea pennata]|uniref:protein S100-A13 n=1 Tax=Rhea pennata TaxID=8795 RepID=UPI002E26DB56
MAAARRTELETAIETLVAVFCRHAAREGRGGALTAARLRRLLRLEPPELSQDAGTSELDTSRDGELSFGEYWRLLGEAARSVRRDGAGTPE